MKGSDKMCNFIHDSMKSRVIGTPSSRICVAQESVDLAMQSNAKPTVTKCVHGIFGKIACRNEWDGHTFLVMDAWHAKKQSI
jgi:hypothetical protein